MLSNLYQLVVAPFSETAPLPRSAHLRPTFQRLHYYESKESLWRPTLTPKATYSGSTYLQSDLASFAVLTWNIDFSAPLPIPRLRTLLSHLEHLFLPIPNDPSPPPTIILLQEFHHSCFPALLAHPFIRAMYEITDISPSAWPKDSAYGSVTLIPKPFAKYASSVFRTAFSNSKMFRDALYVDLDLPFPQPNIENTEAKSIKVRIANTHLESLPGHGDRARPVQLASISQFLSCSGIHGGIVGGDMNAISPSDINLPEKVGLFDPWASARVPERDLGRAEPQGDIEGYTWGYQPSTIFPPGRLDKILLTGRLTVKEMEKVGVGLKFDAHEGDSDVWVSDHYGLLALVMVA